ncbi:hypothetical protein [Maribacter thermophilus]|uniref:hypothetical protein n=1 Tax=Maribacter thermophilus TaxID=1197874 RepID=UPI000640C13D|nr:hypothetical protein [Maribacter thermophilus]
MKISEALTFSSLPDNFQNNIICFIKKLENLGLAVLESPLHIQVYGSYVKVAIREVCATQ